MRCNEHDQPVETTCTWCSQSICGSCLEEAQGHKLCSNCAKKLAGEDGLSQRSERQAPEIVKNVDPKLTPERIDLGKQMIDKKEEKKKFRIRNIPDQLE